MKIIKLWLPVIIWAGIIFYLSSIPHLRSGLKADLVLRKLAHIAVYCILAFLIHRAFKSSFQIGGFRLIIYPAAISFLYAISDEFHQAFVPGRVASGQDVMIDAIGILSYFVFARILPASGGR
ncbi:MAG: VanZ family protein [Candidatus Omnitrophica bacterium]|nr:VanZ family protein [Candidatus Omnitrophota bacterium]